MPQPNKASSTVQTFFRIEPTDMSLVHDARLTVAGFATDAEDARLLMRSLGIAPHEMGILTR